MSVLKTMADVPIFVPTVQGLTNVAVEVAISFKQMESPAVKLTQVSFTYHFMRKSSCKVLITMICALLMPNLIFQYFRVSWHIANEFISLKMMCH